MITDLVQRFEVAGIAPTTAQAAIERTAALDLFNPTGPHTSRTLANLFLAVALEHVDSADQLEMLAAASCQSALLTTRCPVTGGYNTRMLGQDGLADFAPLQCVTTYSLGMCLEDHGEATRTGQATREGSV